MRCWRYAVRSTTAPSIRCLSGLIARNQRCKNLLPLEGSCQETKLSLSQLLTPFFRCALLGTLHPRLVASDASLFSFTWCRLVWRRTIHPSGSRRLDVSPPGQTSAPGIFDAPENRRSPAASNRMRCTNAMAPLRLQEFSGSRQRRRQTQQAGGRPTVNGLRTGRIKRLVMNPNAYLSLPSTQLVALPQPNARSPSKGT